MNWNFGALSRAFAYTMQIGVEFIKAKSAESDGGKEVTQAEIIGLGAKTAALWCADDGKPLEISVSDLVYGFESAGWKLKYESEEVNNG
jgi:hypothetical protein